MGALRTQRDRAMVQAMLLGGLRRCEVLGFRLQDLHLGEWRVFVNEGKGGHQRLVPVSPSFFRAVASYMDSERPRGLETDRVFVVLKGPRRGQPLSAEGLDEILSGARARAGLEHGTCHELRHTCFTRLREAGMSIEALQLLAGHRSIASTPFLDALAAMQDPRSWKAVRSQLFAMWTEGVDIPALGDNVQEMAEYGFAMWARAGREIAATFAKNGSPVAALEGLDPPAPTLHLYAQPPDPAFLAAQQHYSGEHGWFEVRRLEAHGHFPMFEVPGEMAAAIEEFAATL